MAVTIDSTHCAYPRRDGQAELTECYRLQCYHVSNAAELTVVAFAVQRHLRVSSRQSASVVDQQPHHVVVVDD